jgi:hypothetical protein
MTPLLPGIRTFDELFLGWGFFGQDSSLRGRPYLAPKSFYPLTGLPGTIRLRTESALFVEPSDAIVQVSLPRMTNNSLGSFRAVQSAHWMKEGLLPVFVQDRHMIASVLLAFMSQSEHERFNRES